MAASLPDELLARILSPVDSIRSLVQARAVCKSWQAAVESKQVRDLRDTTTADPLIALTGGGIHGRGYSDHVLTNKLSFKFGRDGAWFAGPPMPEPRIGHGVVQVGRKIYVVGGSSEQSGQVKRTLVYDVWTATWSDAPGLRQPRRHAAVVALPDGRILVAGGMSDYHPLRSCELFDTKTETWTAAAPLAEKRWFGAGAVLNGRAHVAGGRSNAGHGSRTMEIYDAAADRWEFGPPCPATQERGCAADANGRLYRFTDQECHMYTPSTEELTVLRHVSGSHFSLHDRMGMSLGQVVDVGGSRGRIIGFHHAWTPNSNLEYGSGSDDDALPDDASDAGVNAMDILVTDNDDSTTEWMRTWWRGARIDCKTALSTCAAVGDEILLFGGDSELHSYGDLEHNVNVMEGSDPQMIDMIREGFHKESIDHEFSWEPLWLLEDATWARSMDQSEEAAATVVHM